MLECVVNISEGRNLELVNSIASGVQHDLLDLHIDPDHNRSVLTLVGESAPRSVTERAVETLDIHRHDGAHPRIGVVDVVPFVPLGTSTLADAVDARNRFADWASSVLKIPCFRYGEERSLPEIRRDAFDALDPDVGPSRPHPTAGSIAVGARGPLIAYNLWLHDPDLDLAQRLARHLRGPGVRALGLAVGGHVQVSMNLIEPSVVGPDQVYDIVESEARIARAELVGLIPESVLEQIPMRRWAQLGLSEEATIENRLSASRGGAIR